MFSTFICGSFHNQDEVEEYIQAWSPSSRKSRKNSLSRSKDTKNPYANRGLDKFSALIADLDNKRKKIYTQKGSEDISVVLFACSNPNNCRPIVVKMKDKRNNKTDVENGKNKPIMHNSSEASDNNYNIEASTAEIEVQQPDQKIQKKVSFSWNYMKLDNWRRPWYYFPVIIVVILGLLAVFGRSFAILCASLGWYLVPTVEGESWNSKKPNKKKEYVRKLSNVKLAGRDELRLSFGNMAMGDDGDRK